MLYPMPVLIIGSYDETGTPNAMNAAWGGISEENVNEYLAFPKIVACGGSWMMKGTPDEIREKTAKAMAVVNG